MKKRAPNRSMLMPKPERVAALVRAEDLDAAYEAFEWLSHGTVRNLAKKGATILASQQQQGCAS